MRFTIKAKLGIAFGAILVLLGGAGTLAVSSLSQSNDRMQSFAARPFSQVQRILRIEAMSYDCRPDVRALDAGADERRPREAVHRVQGERRQAPGHPAGLHRPRPGGGARPRPAPARELGQADRRRDQGPGIRGPERQQHRQHHRDGRAARGLHGGDGAHRRDQGPARPPGGGPRPDRRHRSQDVPPARRDLPRDRRHRRRPADQDRRGVRRYPEGPVARSREARRGRSGPRAMPRPSAPSPPP